MKRIFIWVLILITPISVWFAFMEDGNDAFAMWFGNKYSESTQARVVTKIKLSNGTTLIPAQQFNKAKSQVSYLHVEVKGRNTSNRKIATGLLLVDDEGRRTGYDSINDKYFEEIPNSKYEVKLTPRTKPASEIAVVNIQPVGGQYYRIEVIGHKKSNYGLSVSRYPSPFPRVIKSMPSHIINQGELHSYSVDLNIKSKEYFLSGKADEKISTSFAKESDLVKMAITAADMKIDENTPEFSYKDSKKLNIEMNVYKTDVYSFNYPEGYRVKDYSDSIAFGERENTITTKVLPEPADTFYNYKFNRAHQTLQSFAATVLPHGIGMYADGDSSSVQPVGIIGTKSFTNSHGVKGIQTFVVHKHESYRGELEKSVFSYVYQGPVFVFALEPEQKISPVLVISPYEQSVSSHVQKVAWKMANSVKLSQ